MRRRAFALCLTLALLLAPGFALSQEPTPEKKADEHAQPKEGEKASEAKTEHAEGKGEGHGEEGGTKTLIWKIVNFVAFFGLLFYFLRKPASELFVNRTKAIQQEMLEAKAAREAAEKRLAEIEQKLAHLGEEIAAFRAEAGREDLITAERMRQETEAEAAKILANAEAEIGVIARSARLDLKVYTAQLAVELAKERIQKEMTAETQARLLRHYVADLSDGGKGGKN